MGTIRDGEVKMSVGMPATIYLEQFGHLIRVAFDNIPYLVGSSLKK